VVEKFIRESVFTTSVELFLSLKEHLSRAELLSRRTRQLSTPYYNSEFKASSQMNLSFQFFENSEILSLRFAFFIQMIDLVDLLVLKLAIFGMGSPLCFMKGPWKHPSCLRLLIGLKSLNLKLGLTKYELSRVHLSLNSYLVATTS
jgi:hypothetical protein